MKSRVIIVTPAIAEEYLALNKENRPFDQKWADFLAREMKNGLWRDTGESITFHNKRLINGQHRLTAIIISNKPQQLVIVYTEDENAFDCIDQGKKRTTGQVLKLSGYEAGATLSAAVRFIEIHNHKGTRPERHQSSAMVRNILENHPGIVSSSDRAPKCPSRLCPRSLLVAAHYLFSQSNPDLADEFLHEVATGENLRANHPAMSLRRRMMEKNAYGSGTARKHMLAIFIKAWNARILGNDIKVLGWRGGDDSPEPWPRCI